MDRLMYEGHEVTIVDNFFTGNKNNVEHWIGHNNFEMIHQDIVNPLFIEVDEIYHLASPASPPHYMFNPVKTIKTNTIGTINMLGRLKLGFYERDILSICNYPVRMMSFKLSPYIHSMASYLQKVRISFIIVISYSIF